MWQGLQQNSSGNIFLTLQVHGNQNRDAPFGSASGLPMHGHGKPLLFLIFTHALFLIIV
jgi:hypothetical protein